MTKKRLRFLSFVMAIVMILSTVQLSTVYATESLSTDVTTPFTQSTKFEAGGETVTSNSYRIPAMVTLKDGTMVAAADIRWNSTYDGGGNDTLVARSTDGGVTWSYTAANYLGDNGNTYNGSQSTCFIDPCLTVGKDGQTVYMMVDLYPYGVALNGSGNTAPVTTSGFTSEGYLKLSGDNNNTYNYYLKDGLIYQIAGSPAAVSDEVDEPMAVDEIDDWEPVEEEETDTEEAIVVEETDTEDAIVVEENDGEEPADEEEIIADQPAAISEEDDVEDEPNGIDLQIDTQALTTDTVVDGYTVDAYFNIYDESGKKISNLFYEESPFKVVRTGFLYLTSSTDGGKTWSEPKLLNLKTTSEKVCLVAPGTGITTSDGTMIVPVYSYKGNQETQQMGFLSSTDGEHWTRIQSSITWSSESAVVEIGTSTLRFFYRNDSAKLCYVDYDRNSNTWGSPVKTDIATNSNTQISAITYSKKVNGKQVILISCPAGPNGNGSDQSGGSYRQNGRIFVGYVEEDGTMTWGDTTKVTDNNAFFAYSCLTERSDGSIAILYENKENAWGVGDNCYYTMDMAAYTAEELGISVQSEDDEDPDEGEEESQEPLDNGSGNTITTYKSMTSNGVTISSNQSIFVDLSVTEAETPEANYITNGQSYYVVPETLDGEYDDYAQVTMNIPANWNSSKVVGYVKAADGSITILPGTVSEDGTFTFTTPHFSEVGILETTGASDLTEQTVVLEVGETSSEITVSETENVGTAGSTTSANGAVEADIMMTSLEEECTTELAETLSDGATVVISDGTNYLMLSGSSLNTTTDPAQATVWTVNQSGTQYTLSNNGSYLVHMYMSYSNYNLSVSSSTTNAGWSYDSETGFYYQRGLYGGKYYLTYSDGWTLSSNTSRYGAAYTLTQIEEMHNTTVTFTGLDVTEGTEMEVGDTSFFVIVKAKTTEKEIGMLVSSETTLDALSDLGLTGESYRVTYEETTDKNNVITLEDDKVTSGATAGTAVVTATVVNGFGTTVGTVIYYITVSDVTITDTKNIYVPLNGTASISGLSGEIYEGMLERSIAEYDVLDDGTISFSGKGLGTTTLIVGTTKINVVVCPAASASSSKYLKINVTGMTNCKIYYSINGGELHEVEGTGILIDQTYNGGFNIMFFAAPEEGYVVTAMNNKTSDGQYYSIDDGDCDDGSDSSAFPLTKENKDLTQTPASSSSAWKSGHGLRWALIEKNMTIEQMRAVFTAALEKGAQGVTTITKNDSSSYETEVSFTAEKLPTLEKKIIAVNGKAYTEGQTLEFGDVITYQFTVTAYSKSTTSDGKVVPNVTYSDVVLSDTLIGDTEDGYSQSIDGSTLVVSEKATDPYTVTYTQNYTITESDLSKYTNGTFTNHATLTYKYKSTYGQGSYDASASASVSCKINGIVSYAWMDGLPEGLTEDSTNYPLPDEKIAKYGSLVTVESYDGLPTYDEVNESGVTTGTWTFKGWQYKGEYCKAGSTVTMPTNDSIEFVGIWEYKAAPTYTVSYEWTNAPESETLPTDGSEYLSGEYYEVDGEYGENTTIDDGELIWSFSGWTLNNNIVIGSKEIENGDVTLVGEWTATNKYTSLTIEKQGCDTLLDSDQSFLFNITGTVDNKALNLNVTVHENGSITIDGLEVGVTYTVHENDDWSWRYDQYSWAFTTGDDANEKSGTGRGAISITLSEKDNKLTVTNKRTNNSWLDGNANALNIFTGATTNTTD